MKNKIINITNYGNSSILIIYTGGTFGMVKDSNGFLTPFNFEKILNQIPELKHLKIKLSIISFTKPIDSSNIDIKDWIIITQIIEENYTQYNGFVILHGTDTMAYSSSMISYMLKGLNKPVIFTGAQIPIGEIRSDARENLITTLEIASLHTENIPIINEVCIYFNHVLLRGTRAHKIRSSTFAAFESENYPVLAEAGIEIEFNYQALKLYDSQAKFTLNNKLNPDVSLLKFFPGIKENVIKSILDDSDTKGIILETYGSGNIMNFEWITKILSEAINSGKTILNISQCIGGKVEQEKYETSKKLNEIGVLSGKDMNIEAAVTKMMFALGQSDDIEEIKKLLTHPIAGEMSE